MTRLQRRLISAGAFLGMFTVGPIALLAQTAPSTGQDWFRGSSPALAPTQGDFNPQTSAPPPPAPMPQRANTRNSGSDFPEDTVHDWVMANARAAYSRAMLRRAERELDDAVRDVKLSFEQSSDYRKASADETAAYDAYTAERKRALESLSRDPKYQACLDLRDETGRSIARLRAMHKSEMPHEILIALASQKLQYATDAHAMEAAVLDHDSALRDARQKMLDASAKVASMRAEFDASIRSNPHILEARRNLEDARVATVASEAYLNAASIAGATATDYSYYRHRWDGVSSGGYAWNPYGY